MNSLCINPEHYLTKKTDIEVDVFVSKEASLFVSGKTINIV